MANCGAQSQGNVATTVTVIDSWTALAVAHQITGLLISGTWRQLSEIVGHASL